MDREGGHGALGRRDDGELRSRGDIAGGPYVPDRCVVVLIHNDLAVLVALSSEMGAHVIGMALR